jgi:DNA-binding winged helix-turn-helix (wHTH) protein/tetratricopeptide (TPR) repeat protein
VQGYAIGHLSLHPHRELLDRGAPVAIGGKALDLLSALAAADGGVVTKDELLEKVWRGAIVEDNALQAQISAVRKALGAEAGRLVTVHGRGYRLELNGEAASSAAPGEPTVATAPGNAPTAPGRQRWTRRGATGAVILAGAGVVTGLALWPGLRRHEADPRAVELYRRGQIVQRGELEDAGAARVLYRQAVAIDPDFADAWAALALSDRDLQILITAPFSDPRLVRSAANRALRLDPGNAHAQLALIRLYPPFRRWQAQEERLRALGERHPNVAFCEIFLGLLLLDVGRFEEAIIHARRATEIDPQSLRGWFLLGFSLGLAGRYTESDIALAEGMRRWPESLLLWFTRYQAFLGSRRYAEAAAFVQDSSRRPRAVRDEIAHSLALTADAFINERSKARAIALSRASPARGLIDQLPSAAPIMAGLGLTDMVLEALEAYFFGGSFKGERIAPPGALDSRPSVMLFAPALVPLHDDPRFGRLLERTGLEDYWRKSGTQPDFRRA